MPVPETWYLEEIWYLVYCATCLGSRDNSKYHTHPHTYMTQVGFPSIVWLRLRAFGAHPPSEQDFCYIKFWPRVTGSFKIRRKQVGLPNLLTSVSFSILYLWQHWFGPQKHIDLKSIDLEAGQTLWFDLEPEDRFDEWVTSLADQYL